MNKVFTLITSNPRKIASLQSAVAPYGYSVQGTAIDCPEIQASSDSAVASFSAQWAANKLNQACVKMDSSLCLLGLGGLPGVYVRWFDESIGAERFFDLTRNVTDRRAKISCSIAYCEPEHEPMVFTGSTDGTLPDEVGSQGSFIDRLFVPGELNELQLNLGELRERDPAAVTKIWGKAEQKFLDWLLQR